MQLLLELIFNKKKKKLNVYPCWVFNFKNQTDVILLFPMRTSRTESIIDIPIKNYLIFASTRCVYRGCVCFVRPTTITSSVRCGWFVS